MNKITLDDRMKRYESVPKNYLMRRQPAIIRLDGKAFHSFTRGFVKPFDDYMIEAMQQTMLYLCKEIQGCVFGYTQSDEISLVICDYQKLDTDAWFGYNVQKMVSISASMATLKFNKVFSELVEGLYVSDAIIGGMSIEVYFENLRDVARRGAIFDSRVFNVPIEEVNNYLLWRQRDAIRNSIQGLAQSLYSHKQLEGISSKNLQNKMFTEKGINWNDLPTHKKRGSCCIKCFHSWIIDEAPPIFSRLPNFVNSRIVFEKEDGESK